MSGFRVGDPAVYAGPSVPGLALCGLEVGSVHVVKSVSCSAQTGRVVLRVDACPGFITASSFRPVTRTKTDLSIEAFSTIKPGQFEEQRRVERVKKGVGV